MMLFWFHKKNAAPANDKELQQILQSRHCDKCQRNCLLSAPKCGRGERQAEIVMRNYPANR